MLNTFNELIKNGVAPSPYEMDTQANTPTLDRVVRHWNNYWGLATGTHCSTPDGGKTYIITGQVVDDEHRFNTLLCTNCWQAVRFPHRWMDVMCNNMLKGTYEVINGSKCYVMSTATPEDMANCEMSNCEQN